MIRKVLMVLLVLVAGTSLAGAAGFDHQAHLKEYAADQPCAACHVAGAVSIIPDKAVCLNCHKPEDVAAVVLPPTRTHGPVWALNHRPEAKGSTIDCSACHEQNDCLECHKSGFADEMGSFSNNMINVHRSDFHVTHPIAARTDQRLCSSCHENQFCVDCHDNFNRNDLAFESHRRGFTDGTLNGDHALFTPEQCQSCHPNSVLPSHQWSNNHAREARRSLTTCQSCHSDGHICLKCHSARTGLMVNPHPDDWDDIKGTLKKTSNGKTCRKCH